MALNDVPPIGPLLLPALCLVLGACGGPALSLRFEQRFEIRNEGLAFRRLRSWQQSEGDEIPWCIDGIVARQMGITPVCSLPWDRLFDVPPLPSSEAYYLQGQSRIWIVDRKGAASLKNTCSDTSEHFLLGNAQRRAAAAAARGSGFFEFPADLLRLPSARDDGLWAIRFAYDCGMSELELDFDGHHNRVRWDCNTRGLLGQDGSDEAPQQIQPLLAAIEKAYAAHFPVKTLLPFAQCPTMVEELERREARP